MGVLMPVRDLFCDWKELDHKIEAFRLFQYAERELGVSIAGLPLAETVKRALTRDPFRAIWILEGIGYAKGTASGLAASGMLTGAPSSGVPDRTLIPLHAGMGTAFAERLLDALPAKPSAGEVGDAVEHFVELCEANCSPGWEDATIEPLGLVVRCLHPHLLAPASAAMEGLSPRLRALFWHGVGRSLYFVPTNFMPIPGSHERLTRSAAAEAGNASDRKQVLAGLIWAVTLVNLPRPAILRSFLAVSSELKIQAEFTNGVVSALAAWRHMAPEDQRYIPSYARTLPGQALWDDWVGLPAIDAIENIGPGLERRNQIPALYTYRTLEELRELSGVLSGARA